MECALPSEAVHRCVYSTSTVHKEFYCGTTQKCCESECCEDLLRWYYWFPLALAVLLVFALLLLCWRWNKRRSLPMQNTTIITPIHPIYPSIPPPHSQSDTSLPAPYGLPTLPYSISNYSGYPPVPPPDFSSDQLSNDSPPSYEQLYGINETTGASVSPNVTRNGTPFHTSVEDVHAHRHDGTTTLENSLNVPNFVPSPYRTVSSGYSERSSLTTASAESSHNVNPQLHVKRESGNGQTVLVLTDQSSSETASSSGNSNLLRF